MVEVWPDNWPTVEFFASLGNGCWAVGPNGPIGLRPETFREVRFSLGIGAAQWREMFPDVRAMEDAALKTMRKRQKA